MLIILTFFSTSLDALPHSKFFDEHKQIKNDYTDGGGVGKGNYKCGY